MTPADRIPQDGWHGGASHTYDTASQSTVVGGQLLDAANPADRVRPAMCAVCSSTRRADLLALNLTPADLMGVGLRGRGPLLCLAHYEAALRRVGPPGPTGGSPTCVGPCTTPAAYGVIAAWPLHPTDATQPTWRACRDHLAESITDLATEHATKETP